MFNIYYQVRYISNLYIEMDGASLDVKVALSFPINEFHKKRYLKELAYIYYDKCF